MELVKPFERRLLIVVPLVAAAAGCSSAGSNYAAGRPGGDRSSVEPPRDAVVVQATPVHEAVPGMDSASTAPIELPPQPGGASVSRDATTPAPGGGSGVMTPRRVTVTGSPTATPPRPSASPPPPSASPPPSPSPSRSSAPVEMSEAPAGSDMDDGAPMELEESVGSSRRYSHRARRRARRERRRSERDSRRASSDRSAPAAESAPMVEAEGGLSGEYWHDEMGYYRNQPIQRMLTAATVADVDRRQNYLGYLERHVSEQSQLGLDLRRRVRFRVVDGGNRPIHDAAVTLVGNGVHVSGRTHADGIWDFYPGVSAPQASGQMALYIQHRGDTSQAMVPVPAGGDGRDIFVRLPNAVAASPAALDLAFLIDVTGSMSDELRYVNEEVLGIVERVRGSVPQVNVRVAATFYRDRGDPVPIEQIPFSSDVRAFQAQMRYVQATGGGDYPEDVNLGLAAALTTLQWRSTPAVRVLVVIADAPPQRYADFPYTYHNAMVDASARGIRFLPVAASGADRVVEYLFRAMGALTSTPYVYLTNDSGVGGHHMEADTDRVAVEMFSDLLTRLLIADLQGVGMHEAIADGPVLAPLQ